MIHDDFNFTLDSTDFPVSIEEFAAYIDGNLTGDDMQRVSTVIEHDDTMQDVLDSMKQSEMTLADYGLEDVQLPEVLEEMDFYIPEAEPINAFAVEEFCDTNDVEQPPIEDRHFIDETHSDIDHNEINHDEETFDADSTNGVDYDEYNDL